MVTLQKARMRATQSSEQQSKNDTHVSAVDPAAPLDIPKPKEQQQQPRPMVRFLSRKIILKRRATKDGHFSEPDGGVYTPTTHFQRLRL